MLIPLSVLRKKIAFWSLGKKATHRRLEEFTNWRGVAQVSPWRVRCSSQRKITAWARSWLRGNPRKDCRIEYLPHSRIWECNKSVHHAALRVHSIVIEGGRIIICSIFWKIIFGFIVNYLICIYLFWYALVAGFTLIYNITFLGKIYKSWSNYSKFSMLSGHFFISL